MAEPAFPGLGFDPAPGDANSLRDAAAAWSALAATLADEAQALSGLRDGLDWQGRAAQVCLDRLHVVPADLATAADACRSAAGAVQHHAEQLPHWQASARTLEDTAAAARHALHTSDDPHVAQTAHDQLVEALRRADRLRDDVEADAVQVCRALAAACDHAPHKPGWFHRMLHDLSGDLHAVAAAMHDLVVELAPTVQAVADWCSKASSTLAEIGFFVSLVPGAGDMVGGFIIGASIALSVTAVAGHGLLAAEGLGSWRAVAYDGVTLTVALASHGLEEPIQAQADAGREAAAALSAPWRSMPYMTEKEFVLRAVRLHVDGAGAALGAVDLAHLPEDWSAMLGRWRPRGRPVAA